MHTIEQKALVAIIVLRTMQEKALILTQIPIELVNNKKGHKSPFLIISWI